MDAGPHRLALWSEPRTLDELLPAEAPLAQGWSVCRAEPAGEADGEAIRVEAVRGDERAEFTLRPLAEDSSGAGLEYGELRIGWRPLTPHPTGLGEVARALGERFPTQGGAALLARLAAAERQRRLSRLLSGGPPAGVEHHAEVVSTGDWRTGRWKVAAREALVGQRGTAIRLGRLVDPETLPKWACVEPWTRLEFHSGGSYGPCCASYLVSSDSLRAGGAEPAELWNGEGLRAFRRAMVDGRIEHLCSKSCPVLSGRTDTPDRIELQGGPASFVEAQLTLVDEILNGRETLTSGPLIACFPTTTYCNYDCLMCRFGAEGTLSDELPESFYTSLRRFAPGLQRLEALGGEPLASPVFRKFLAEEDFSQWPGLEIALITNGSYLTPKEQQKLTRAPMHLVVSLNAATDATYAAVNRGLPFGRIRDNLEALHARRRSGEMRGSVVYSMVLLRQNIHEIKAFAKMARDDGVKFRFMLPVGNLNETSIFRDARAMGRALADLEEILADEEQRGAETVAGLRGEVSVLRTRVAAGVEGPTESFAERVSGPMMRAPPSSEPLSGAQLAGAGAIAATLTALLAKLVLG
jgi:wyosine [tRNA(Phe)-imidazoG37] synthetase (radical SAM superfamily)